MTYDFILAIKYLLNIDCDIYFNKKDVPIPHFEKNESICAVFPKEKIVFLDIDVIPDIEQFYIFLCNSLYEIKLSDMSYSVIERSQLCNVFVYHVMKTVFGLEVDFEKNDLFLQYLKNIQKQYPEQNIRQTLEDFGFEGQFLFDNINIQA